MDTLHHVGLVDEPNSPLLGGQGEAAQPARQTDPATTLAAMLAARGPIPGDEAARITTACAESLAAAHRQGIVHGNVEPGNVIIGSSGEVRLINFSADQGGSSNRDRLPDVVLATASSRVMSTGEAEGAGHRDDLQALGSLLQAMVAPRQETSPTATPQVADALFVDEPVSPDEPVSVLPPGMGAVIDRLRSPDPSYGYPSAEAAAADLRALPPVAPLLTAPVQPGNVGFGPADPHGDKPDEVADELDHFVSTPVFLGMLACLLVLVVGLALYLSDTISGSSSETVAGAVDVPTVIGDRQAVATETLAAAGFLVDEEFVVSDEHEPGTVMAQEPAPRSQIEPGSRVTISIAAAPNTILVPDIIGKSRSDAADELSALGFTVEVRRESSDVVELDHVIGQSLRAGQEVDNGADITMVVSTGPERAIVPQLVGMPMADGSAQLDERGLVNVRIEYEPSPDIPPDSIVRTEPAADSQVELTAPVTVFVSTGDQDFVPAVVGLTRSDAEQLLWDNGFGAQVETVTVDADSGLVGMVLAQGPESGALVPIGSNVWLQVGEEPEDNPFKSWWEDRKDRGRDRDDDD